MLLLLTFLTFATAAPTRPTTRAIWNTFRPLDCPLPGMKYRLYSEADERWADVTFAERWQHSTSPVSNHRGVDLMSTFPATAAIFTFVWKPESHICEARVTWGQDQIDVGYALAVHDTEPPFRTGMGIPPITPVLLFETGKLDLGKCMRGMILDCRTVERGVLRCRVPGLDDWPESPWGTRLVRHDNMGKSSRGQQISTSELAISDLDCEATTECTKVSDLLLPPVGRKERVIDSHRREGIDWNHTGRNWNGSEDVEPECD